VAIEGPGPSFGVAMAIPGHPIGPSLLLVNDLLTASFRHLLHKIENSGIHSMYYGINILTLLVPWAKMNGKD